MGVQPIIAKHSRLAALQSRVDRVDLEGKCPPFTVGQKASQGFFDNGKGDVTPGDVFGCKQPDIRTLTGGVEREVCQLRPEHQVDLIDMHDIEEQIRPERLDPGPGFLPGFAMGAFGDTLPILQVPGRQGPLAPARLDVPQAQENLILSGGDAAHYQPGILVVDPIAAGADVARPVIVRRDDTFYRGCAVRTVIHILILKFPCGSQLSDR